MVFYRSYSYEDVTDDDPYSEMISHRASLKAAAAMDDSDAAVRKSRRYDDLFMRNINSRLDSDAVPKSVSSSSKVTSETRALDDSFLPRRSSSRYYDRVAARSRDDSDLPRRSQYWRSQYLDDGVHAALKGQKAVAKASSSARPMSRIQDYWHEGDYDTTPRVKSVKRKVTTVKKGKGTGAPRYKDYYYPEFYGYSVSTPLHAANLLTCRSRLLTSYEPEMPPPSTYAHIRERLRNVQDGADKQRLMIERYIPVDVDAKDIDVAAGILGKFEAMSTRMPHLSSQGRKATSQSSSSSSSESHMSDARRKIRDTLKKNH